MDVWLSLKKKQIHEKTRKIIRYMTMVISKPKFDVILISLSINNHTKVTYTERFKVYNFGLGILLLKFSTQKPSINPVLRPQEYLP